MSTFGTALGLGADETPFPWQEELLARFLAGISGRMSLDIPTGLGKTSVMAAWLVAFSQGARLPRRLVYVVDRRAVVDQATGEAERLRSWVDNGPEVKARLGLANDQSLPISTLRGQYVDNGEWLADPSAPAIVVGTVDMIGSRLLFEGYGVSRKMRPYHSGMLGADSLFVVDEAHLVPPFEMMLQAIVSRRNDFGPDPEVASVVPDLKLLSLSATGRNAEGQVVRLTTADLGHPIVKKRLHACKRLSFQESDGTQPLCELLAQEAWALAGSGRSNVRVIVFSNRRDDAERALAAVEKLARGDKKQGIKPVGIETELFVGARRIHEREQAALWLSQHGFLAGSKVQLNRPAFVFATSAGEVGVDLDADHMACDLVEWERMVQRLGRVNRRGNGEATIRVVVETQPDNEPQREKVAALRRPIEALPRHDDCYDASPGAIRIVKIKADDDKDLADILAAATSPAPLRPALTRPVVDAWSMTSLEKHTGRPLVAPWLRGWVDDDPQTTILWRRWLPVCKESLGTERKRQGEVPQASKPKQEAEAREFFEQAPPQLTEILETESSRVLEWLTKRAKEIQRAINNQAKSTEYANDEELLERGSVVGIILSPALDVVRLVTLGELAFDGDDKKDSNRRKETLQRDLYKSILVLDVRFGGLNGKGLLDHLAASRDTETGDDGIWAEARFRVRMLEHGSPPAEAGWRTCFRSVFSVSPQGEPQSWLLVETSRQMAVSEDSRSIGPRVQELSSHHRLAIVEADRLARRLGLPDDYAKMLRLVARVHDEGKGAERWQRVFSAPSGDTKYAKTPGPVKFRLLDGYRHEFGSLPIVEADSEFQTLDLHLQELAMHLVAAHHGLARPVIRTDGCDDGPPSVLEGRARSVALRFARLQRRWGPWGLAWWESLLRAADQQASRKIEVATSHEKEAPHG